MYSDLFKKEIIKKIRELKKLKNAIILAHYYQIKEIQDIADYMGDSFGLSQKATSIDSDVIVFCGVKFMAESAGILSPDKTILLPEITAGCSLADMIDVEGLREMKRKYPDYSVVTYINSPAEVKAESDVCCTSSNALKIVEALENDKILFVPDKNLGRYVAEHTEKDVIFWDGYCNTHYHIKIEDLKRIKEIYSGVPILVHPECRPEVVCLADYTGSTAGILKYIRKSELNTFIIGTELGIIQQLKKEYPEKNFIGLSPHLICHDMKKTNLKKVLNSLENEEYRIDLEDEVREKAYQALKKMIELAGRI